LLTVAVQLKSIGMSDSPQQPISVCPRCGASCAGQAWCQKCGLNLRIPVARGASGAGATPTSDADPATEPLPVQPPRTWSPPPPNPLAQAWERVTQRVDPMLAVAAGAIGLIAVVALVVVLTKGGGKPSGQLAGLQLPGVTDTEAVPTETTPTDTTTETTSTETTTTDSTATTPAVESSQVEQVLGEYTQDYSEENLEAFKGLFASTLERRDAGSAPEDLEAALATYQRQFGELSKPTYRLSSENVQPGNGEANATADYSISSQKGTVTGSIAFHFVEQEGKLLIDKLSITPSK
jgi:hypothetical protein